MILILLLSMFSIGYTNQINSVSGNIEKFSLMNGNSFINNTIDGADNNLYRISLIQYPEQISLGQFLYIEKYKKYFRIDWLVAPPNGSLLDSGNQPPHHQEFVLIYFWSLQYIYLLWTPLVAMLR